MYQFRWPFATDILFFVKGYWLSPDRPNRAGSCEPHLHPGWHNHAADTARAPLAFKKVITCHLQLKSGRE